MAEELSFADQCSKLVGKRVKIVSKNQKSVDLAPGESTSDASKFYFVDYYGVVLDPAVRPYPPDNPNGVKSIYIQTWDARKTIFAIELDVIEEIDDEIAETQPQSVEMSGLTTPSAIS